MHKFHVTYGRMAVEDNQAMLQIRLFKDDRLQMTTGNDQLMRLNRLFRLAQQFRGR